MSMPASASAAMTASLMGSVCVRVKSSVSPVGALSTVSRLSAGPRVIAQVKGFAVLWIKLERVVFVQFKAERLDLYRID